jgi:hypothetical protein
MPEMLAGAVNAIMGYCANSCYVLRSFGKKSYAQDDNSSLGGSAL